MAFFDFFPYTNWHNVNLDWVLQKVKEWGEKVDANDALYQTLKDEWEEFREEMEGVDVETGINDLARIALKTPPAEYAIFKQTDKIPGYTIGSVCWDGDHNVFWVVGGSTARDGSGIIVRLADLNFASITTTTVQMLGHANDVAYYDDHLYICTANNNGGSEGGAAVNAVVKVNATTHHIVTTYANCPTNTIGIARASNYFYLLAPPYIYRTNNFVDFVRVVDNADIMVHAAGIASNQRSAQTIFTVDDDMIGYVASYNSENQSYALVSYFRTDGDPVGMATFACECAEAEGAVYVDGVFYLVTSSTTWPATVYKSDKVNKSFTRLYNHDDLNDCAAPGIYECTGSDIASTLSNCPVNTGFRMETMREGIFHIIQLLIDSDKKIWMRRRSWSTMNWGAWKELVKLPDAPSTDGIYTLTCVVASGTVTYSWQ